VATGGGYDSERELLLGHGSGVVEHMREFDAAPRLPLMIASLERDRRVRCELFAGLVDAALTVPDEAGEYQRLRLCPTFGNTLLDEELIGPPFRHRDWTRHCHAATSPSPQPSPRVRGAGGTRVSGRVRGLPRSY